MRKYELTAVFPGTIPDTELGAAVDRVKKIITDSGIASVEPVELGKHKLSYPIGENKFGHLVSFVFETEPAVAAAFQKKLNLSKDVVRFAMELFVGARFKRQPQIADNPLIKASREKEREDRAERSDRGNDRDDRGSAVFAAGHVASGEIQKMDDKPVDLAEIDKQLDKILEGDLTPSV